MKEKYSWSRVLNNPVEEALEQNTGLQDHLFDVRIQTSKLNENFYDAFPEYVRTAPFLFSFLNKVL